MAHRIARFLRDTRGTTPERWAIIASVAGVICVVGTHMLDIAVKNGAVPAMVLSRDASGNNPSSLIGAGSSVTSVKQTAAGIDYTATASIPSIAAANHLDPCTGKAKQ